MANYLYSKYYDAMRIYNTWILLLFQFHFLVWVLLMIVQFIWATLVPIEQTGWPVSASFRHWLSLHKTVKEAAKNWIIRPAPPKCYPSVYLSTDSCFNCIIPIRSILWGFLILILYVKWFCQNPNDQRLLNTEPPHFN